MADYPTIDISIYVGDEDLSTHSVKTATGLSSSTTGSCVLVSGTIPTGMTFQDVSAGGRQGSHGYWFYAQFKLNGHPTVAGTYSFIVRGTIGNQTLDSTVTVSVTYSPEPIYFTVSYQSDHGTTPQSDTVLSGTQIQLPSISDPSYTFNGWYTSYTGGTRVGGAGDSYVVSGSTMLYAQWTAKPIVNLTIINMSEVGDYYIDGTRVTFSGGVNTVIPVVVGQNRTIQFVVTDTSHYQFDKFSLSEHGGEDWTTTDNPYVLTNIIADTTVSADVVSRTYTITFDATTNGGTLSGSSTKTVILGQQYGALPTATKQYYTFSGWFTAATGGNRIVSTTVFNAGADQTLYAQFQPIKYTITWKNYDDTTLLIDSNVSPNTVPEYTGTTPYKPATEEYYYLFSGWNPTPYAADKNQTYTAQYTGYPVTTYRLDDKGRLNVFDYIALKWELVDEAAFVLSFEAGGGTFKENSAPMIKIKKCKSKDGNGQIIDTLSIPSAYTDYSSAFLMETYDGNKVYVWALAYNDCTEIEISIKNLPTEPTTGNNKIEPPSGFNSVLNWEMISPYYKFLKGTSDTEYEVTLNRSTIDNVRQALVLPVWVPTNDDRLRAIIVASGLGSLNFGDIQSVNTTYNSRLTTIPIVCHGYTGSYCMDLGVSKTISLSYIRTSPQSPDNTVANSVQWDNATWISKLKEFTDRWQMRTNGNLFYLKRPNNPRLANGFNDNDPAADYIEEINGENCYITSAPVQYLAGHPYMIKGTINLTMGTLYPKQTPATMIQVTMKWDESNSRPERNIYLQYPKYTDAVAPSIPYIWTPIQSGDNYIYAASLYYYKNNVKTTLLAGSYFRPNPDGTTTIYADLATIDSAGQKLITIAGGGSFTITPSGSNDMVITAYLIGGGGGGGGGAMDYTYYATDKDRFRGSGGAGGASGEYGSYTYTVAPTGAITVTYSIGSGGSGGETRIGYNTAGEDGHSGGNTSITVNGATNTVNGGAGGPAAARWDNPGTWSVTPGNNSYKGGNGGQCETFSAYDGQSGTAPTGQFNMGSGGLRNINGDITMNNYVGGGGGGGGAIIIPNKTGTAKGGCGASVRDGESINGSLGSGGGGGASQIGIYSSRNTVNGGRGGDGVIFVTVQNGTIG